VANHTRLRLLVALAQHQPQSVSGLAAELNLPLPVASLFLRLLESRSLLTAERVRRRVEYRFATTGNTVAFVEFVQTLQATLRRNPKQAAEVFRWATGFTHPTRIVLYRRLHQTPASVAELAAHVGLSRRATARHVAKLFRRGFIASSASLWTVRPPVGGVARTLAALALD
jgi:DNA-binding MarR family transcriptional regulator